MADQPTIQIAGSVHGQAAAGNFVYQAQSIGGQPNGRATGRCDRNVPDR
jgi:hypothetical protein